VGRMSEAKFPEHLDMPIPPGGRKEESSERSLPELMRLKISGRPTLGD